MTESTQFLTSTQAAARLGVKTATLYAYVSRGLLPRHRSPDGRASLFDAADVARLARRGGAERTAPSDVTVGSELTLVEADGLWFRGIDVLRASREFQFEEIASLLWTGSLDRTETWHANPRSVKACTQAQAMLRRNATLVDRITVIPSAVAAAHADQKLDAIDAACDLMGSLVDCLPGRTEGTTVAQRLTAKFGGRSLIDVFDTALSLTCERGLTHGALIARLTTATGGGVASAVAAAIHAAVPNAKGLAALEEAFATAAEHGPERGAQSIDQSFIDVRHPFRNEDPRTPVLLAALAESAPGEAALVASVTHAVAERGVAHPNVWYGLAALTWAAGMAPGTAGAIALISQSVGWIAHALEERNRPTPYRPRLTYTGPPPRGSAPRRTLDAVTQYLARS